jgi:hypothetical protein
VEVILVNGTSVDFSHQVSDGVVDEIGAEVALCPGRELEEGASSS